jgi:polyhydroxyalkanoate synthase
MSQFARNKSDTDVKVPDPVAFTQALIKIGEQSQVMMQSYLDKNQTADPAMLKESTRIIGTFMQMAEHVMAQEPARLIESGIGLWQDYMMLWQNTARRFMGDDAVEPVADMPAHDRRFNDAAWQENALFDCIKQSYFLTSRWLQNTVRETEGLDEKTAKKMDFYTRQFVDAMAPSNFMLTNPEVIRRTVETGGDKGFTMVPIN